MDSSPPFLFPWAIAFWATYITTFYVSEAGFIRRTKATLGDGSSVKQDSLAFLGMMTLCAKIFALVLAWYQVTTVSLTVRPWLFGVGIGLMVSGAALRQHCFRMLGSAFTGDVRASQEQVIVDRGAYRYVRHPGYLAGILMMFGFGLATTSLAAGVAMLIASLYIYLRRIAFEEAALEHAVGLSYTEYATKRKRLVPFVY